MIKFKQHRKKIKKRKKMSVSKLEEKLNAQIIENNKLKAENSEMFSMLDAFSIEITGFKKENEDLKKKIKLLKDLLYENISEEKKKKVEEILNSKNDTEVTEKKEEKKENNKKSKEEENKEKQLKEKLTKFSEEKEKIELNFILIKDENDLTSEKITSLSEKQKMLNDLFLNIIDSFNILNEQKQVEPEFFLNEVDYDIASARVLSLNDAIFNLRDKLNYANNNIKDKIENSQREIQNQLNSLNDYLNARDEKYNSECENIIKYLHQNLLDCEKLSNEFSLIKEEINELYIELKTTLNELKIILENFLKKINKKIEENNKEVKRNINNEITNQLLRRTIKREPSDYDNYNKKNSQDLRESIFIEEVINPNDFFEPQLLKTNWQETSTISSNGIQTIEVKLILKAVACRNLYYSSFTHAFDLDSNINIVLCEINGKEVRPNFAFHRLTFNFKLCNNQSLPIRFVYLKEPLVKKKFYNQIWVGLSGSLYGRKAHYTLNLSDDLVLCKIDDNFFKDKGKGSYSWQGIVPYGGKMTSIAITPIKSKWKIYIKNNFFSNGGNIKNTTLSLPKYCESCNNKILSYNIRNNSANYIDGFHIIQVKDRIESIYNNLNTPNGFIIFDIILENYSNKNFECLKNITIPPDEKANALKFKTLSNKIIEEDKSGEPNYIKIGKWIKNKLTYKLSMTGKKLTALEILECKQGVCEHFTILYNALLNSIGIPAIYAHGYTMEGSSREGPVNPKVGHCWTIAQINKKWIGLDCTWGILTGNLPTSHIFFGYGKDNVNYQFHLPDLIVYDTKHNELTIENVDNLEAF